MKVIVGFTIWNKVDQIAWLLDGVVRNFDPAETVVVPYFDVCKDGSIEAFDAMTEFWLTKRGFEWHKLTADQAGPDQREIGGHAALMDFFMKRSDADLLIVAQDDQHFDAPPVPPLRVLQAKVPNLGLVGGRDGYDWGYQRFAGSRWSESAVHERLDHGDVRQRTYMNSGPIVYNRPLIERVGPLDRNFEAFYIWDDYGHRAHQAGFDNFVMGMYLTHAKFGRVISTQLYTASGHDINLLKRKHGLW